jgi:hypothetical protein
MQDDNTVEHSDDVKKVLEEAMANLKEFEKTYRRETGKINTKLFILPMTEKPTTHKTFDYGFR